MVALPTFLMEKLGPFSSVFVHRTVMRRSFPLASHGLAKEPTPLEFDGQSWWASGGGAALAVAEGAADGGGAGALALAAGASALGSSLEQPRVASESDNNRAGVRIAIS